MVEEKVKIAKELYGYSKHAAKGKMNHPRKGVQMKSNTNYFSLVPEKILQHYKNVQLDFEFTDLHSTARNLPVYTQTGKQP